MSEETELEKARAALAAVEAEVEATWRRSLELQVQLAPLVGSTDPDEIMRANAIRKAIDRLRSRLPNPQWRDDDEPPTELQVKLDQARERVALVEKQIELTRARVKYCETLAARADDWREMYDLSYQLLTLAIDVAGDTRDLTILSHLLLADYALRDIASLDAWRERLRQLGG